MTVVVTPPDASGLPEGTMYRLVMFVSLMNWLYCSAFML